MTHPDDELPENPPWTFEENRRLQLLAASQMTAEEKIHWLEKNLEELLPLSRLEPKTPSD
jgi:hypothetical protein